MNVPKRISAGFQQNDRRGSQNLNNDTFCRLPVTNAQCIIGTEKCRDAGISKNIDDEYMGYGLIKEAALELQQKMTSFNPV